MCPSRNAFVNCPLLLAEAFLNSKHRLHPVGPWSCGKSACRVGVLSVSAYDHVADWLRRDRHLLPWNARVNRDLPTDSVDHLRAALTHVQVEEAEALQDAFELSRNAAHPERIHAALRECETLLRKKMQLQQLLAARLDASQPKRESLG